MNNVSYKTIELLREYQSLLLKWNKKINLISESTINIFWDRHVKDSLQLLKFIKNKDIHVVDIGTGGGLPGIVLSIAGIKKVSLIESDVRKVAFLLQAAKMSKNEVKVINDRVENIVIDCDIIIARAFSELTNIFKITKNFKIKDKYLLLKGEKIMREIENAKKQWLFNFKLHDSITLSKGKVVEIKDLRCI